MTRRTIIAAAAAAVAVLGTASAAVAAQTSGTTSSSAKATTTGKHHHEAFRGEYAQWTTYDAKTKADVVHDGIKGSVSAVSPTSVTVQAKDGTSETFTVSSATKVAVKGDAKGTAGSIGQVKVGDRVELVGTGKSSFAATHLRDRGAASATATATPAPTS